MTSAVRDAANGKEFADDVASRFGLDVHVISGDEEAHLTYLGATDATRPPAGAPGRRSSSTSAAARPSS